MALHILEFFLFQIYEVINLSMSEKNVEIEIKVWGKTFILIVFTLPPSNNGSKSQGPVSGVF